MPVTSSQTRIRRPNAIQLLTADHQKVAKIFGEFKKIKDKENSDAKQSLVKTACEELTIHAKVEEEIFYPALRAAMKDEDLIDEAEVEHTSMKQLISDLESMQPDDDLYDAKVTVLSEYVKHHVKEEQGEIFPKAKKTNLDMAQLGQEIADRKRVLKNEIASE
jgi:hemerythrin superfamily protein